MNGIKFNRIRLQILSRRLISDMSKRFPIGSKNRLPSQAILYNGLGRHL